ncbi:MAG: DUF4384 domain-containing protein, partial [Gemmatimonadales bacterium]|nr:DUF4384 domain-containing protein [Gemmatimonadales bacterium]
MSAVSQDPPIRIWLNSDRHYERGDRAKVQVETDNDGYLVVLHANADGRIRVLFPLDPTDDNFVRGGRRYEIKGRGGREAFMVDVNSGQGTVYAAVSRDPFRFDQFMRNDHWDATALSPNQLASDPEPELNDLTQRMATGRFEYDLLRYDVSYGRSVSYYTPAPVRRAYYTDPFCDRYVFRHDCDPYYYGGGSGVSVNLVFGRSYRSYYDPFYDPFYNNRYSYDPYYYGYDPYYYRPYYGTPTYYSPRPYYYNPRPVYTGRLYTPYQFKAVNRTFGGAGSIEAARDRGGDDRRVNGTDPRSFATPRNPAGGTSVQPKVTNQ